MKEATLIAESENGTVKYSTGKSTWDYTFTVPLKRGYWVGTPMHHIYAGMDKDRAVESIDV